MDNQDDKTRTHNVLTNGTMVSHYRIVEKIGAGGMGVVYLAEDTKLKRKVALKFLSVDQIHDKSVLQQFTKEAQAAARLQHPNIITVHEVNEHNGVPYIAMAHIEGQSLAEFSANRSMPIAELIELGIQITRGLAVAHENGVVHRDLKPGNLMIDSAGAVKILDFGLAVLSDIESRKEPESTVTSNPLANRIAGTISYMAPEQLLGQEISARVDIFAFGIILYELITEEHPFEAPSVSEISASILRDTPTDLYSKRSNVPYDLKRIVNRCLAKKPEKRFQTARDVCNELEELSNELKQDAAIIVTGQGPMKADTTLREESFVITTDLVRRLSLKDPRMIGSQLVYTDNGVSSDALIVYLHGIGNDHRQFSEVLQQLPFRAVSLSLFGFDPSAQLRLPLTLHDHSILIHAWLKELICRLRPRQLILSGFSSGADHVLHFLSSEEFVDIKVTGLLSLGCNLHLDDCFVTSKLADLASGDEDQILSTIKEFSIGATSMRDWLLVHDYLLASFSKFGTQTEPLSQFARDILAPFEDGSMDQFAAWYQACLKRVPHIRFVTDGNGLKSLDRMLQLHLEQNVLGDDFHEDTIVRDPVSHMELGQPDVICKHTLALMKLIESK